MQRPGRIARADDSAVHEVSQKTGSTEQPVGINECLHACYRPIDDQASAIHRRRAGVSIGLGQSQPASAQLDYITRTADHPVKCCGVASIEGQSPIVDHISSDASGGSTIADLERSSTDRCAAAVRVRARQRQRPEAILSQ